MRQNVSSNQRVDFNYFKKNKFMTQEKDKKKSRNLGVNFNLEEKKEFELLHKLLDLSSQERRSKSFLIKEALFSYFKMKPDNQ